MFVAKYVEYNLPTVFLACTFSIKWAGPSEIDRLWTER